ncbi:PREDICTED: abscission/NoCut checkpoint regulator [Ceratosolen solmsi marchali]|uniref:Abscission/NoCut checkpoint regulator n=1 Tax=Ceratosolen solmsi marchali TaxID=326594 RepID=A0AAJ6YQU3_9HYME|nr:PREDICTED: abscission/NoCut checkpoint regulator [Ceratosolen solmsi marchali]
MSCNICQVKFSFFTQENGCPNCRFACCNKCLQYRYNLPNIGEKKICARCYNKLQMLKKKHTLTEDIDISDELNKPLPPIDITKKLESLENPARPPIVMYKQSSKLDNLRAGLNPVDHEIINRLKKLKEEDKQLSVPSEDEIRRRLAILKDEDPDIVNRPTHQIDIRTNQQKTDDLINEYLERINIAKSDDKTDSNIQARLDNLRGVDSSKYAKQSISDIEIDDDVTAVNKIIKKALAEAALEKKYGEEIRDEFEDPDSDLFDTGDEHSDDSSSSSTE